MKVTDAKSIRYFVFNKDSNAKGFILKYPLI